MEFRDLIHQSSHALASPDRSASVQPVDADKHRRDFFFGDVPPPPQDRHDLMVSPRRADVARGVTNQDCPDFVQRVRHNRHGWNVGKGEVVFEPGLSPRACNR